MNDLVELSPGRFAALVAPAISRCFVSGIQPDEDGRRVVRDHGGPAVGFMIDLRNPLASGRVINRAALGNLYRYTDPDEVDDTMRRTVEHGLLRLDADGYRPTGAGREFLDALITAQARTVARRWGSVGAFVRRLNELLETVLDAAVHTAGPAFSVQAPPHDPVGTPAELALLNRISTLRYYRSDAHATAWQQAGLAAADMMAQPWGTAWTDQRHQIETTTNELAGQPFAVLTAGDRLQLLADLAALH